jgi:hypothetical protein
MAGVAYWGTMPLSIAFSWRLLYAGIIEVIAIVVCLSLAFDCLSDAKPHGSQ